MFRVDDNEWGIIKGLAKQANLSCEEYIRRCCLSNDKIIVQDGKTIQNLIREINFIGNNINQIARIANSTKNISHEAIQKVIAWEKEIRHAVHDVKFMRE